MPPASPARRRPSAALDATPNGSVVPAPARGASVEHELRTANASLAARLRDAEEAAERAHRDLERLRSQSSSSSSAVTPQPPPIATPTPHLPAVMVAPVVALLAAFFVLCEGSPHGSERAFQVGVSALIALLAFVLVRRVTPGFALILARADLCGIDRNKLLPGRAPLRIPEGLGIVCGVVYLLSIILFLVLRVLDLPLSYSLAEFNAALTSICFIILLGFVDDVVDLKWRYKLVLPFFASLPLIAAYVGSTFIVLPKPLHGILPHVINLHFLYHIFMVMFAIFCTNSINIFAGINGLEAGQSFVIALFVCLHNVIEIALHNNPVHMFSLCLMLPFLGSVLGLLSFNWFPSNVFVGDTFTYFAGMIFAVVGIESHFIKTMMLMFIPQLFNFLVSLPQIFGVFGPCPRHRLARLDPETGLLHGVREHHNLLNFTLRAFGPMTERRLCVVLMLVQTACCLIGLFVRYAGAKVFYAEDLAGTAWLERDV